MIKKKLVIVSTSEISIRSFLIDHIKSLSNSNFEIFLITNFEFKKNIYKSLNIKLININFKRKINIFSDFYSLILLIFFLIKIRPYLTISISPKAGLLNAIASFLTKIKFRTHIFTGQVWVSKRGIFRNILKFFDKLISLLSTNILIDGNSQKKFLIKNGIINNKINCKVIYNGSVCGVETKKFKKNSVIRKKIRKSLKINTATTALIYVGRINKDKGIIDLIDTYYKLRLKFKNLCLILIGNDEIGMDRIINRKEKYANNIKLFNYKENVVKFLQASDIFCFPSKREGFGLSVLEASSCELPVVCSDIYGLNDTFVHKKTGYRFKLNNNEEMYKYILNLVKNKNLRKMLGNNGRKFVKENFERKKVIKEYINFFNKLTSE